MKNKRYMIMQLLLIPLSLTAQDSLMTEGRYRLADETALWSNTDISAGMTLDSRDNRGRSYIGLMHQGGDFTRVQDGTMENRLTFSSERYQKISEKIYGYGRFRFDMGRTKGRAWSDVMRSYNTDPYFSGSAVKGKYDLQRFDLTAALSTTPIHGFTCGLRLDYQVADLSRLRDPRSRTNLLDYKITPSATFSLDDNNTVGLSVFYNRRKEKLPSFSNAQSDAQIPYYYFTGLENALMQNGSTYTYAQREWVNHQFGASASYFYHSDALKSLNTVSASRGAENVYYDAKAEIGKYYNYNYGISSQNRIFLDDKILSADVSLEYLQGYADEYRQNTDISIDSVTGYSSTTYSTILIYKKRYQVNVFDLDIHPRLSFTGDDGISAYIGVDYQLRSVKNKYLLRTSEMKYADMLFGLEGGLRLFGSLYVDAFGQYKISTSTTLDLYDSTTDVAQNVLIPNMDYYGAGYWRGRLKLTYQFPLNIKGYRANWFVSVYDDYTRSNNKTDWNIVGFSIGILN